MVLVSSINFHTSYLDEICRTNESCWSFRSDIAFFFVNHTTQNTLASINTYLISKILGQIVHKHQEKRLLQLIYRILGCELKKKWSRLALLVMSSAFAMMFASCKVKIRAHRFDWLSRSIQVVTVHFELEILIGCWRPTFVQLGLLHAFLSSEIAKNKTKKNRFRV